MPSPPPPPAEPRAPMDTPTARPSPFTQGQPSASDSWADEAARLRAENARLRDALRLALPVLGTVEAETADDDCARILGVTNAQAAAAFDAAEAALASPGVSSSARPPARPE